MVAEALGALVLTEWLYLLLGHGGFWRIRPEDSATSPPAGRRVVAVIPARNEADSIGAAVTSLLEQQFPGELHIILVDDQSGDGTAELALTAARGSTRLTVLPGGPLPAGWTGKLWAVSQGVSEALTHSPDYLLFTDADIVHASHNLASLIARAERDGYDLVSYMVKLHCRSWPERALMPAFVFFFFQLYPPRWIAQRTAATAGAAGGCVLLRPNVLKRSGGIEAIRGELIDDCALAQQMKRAGGRIWLGAAEETRSLRAYTHWSEVWAMIARTAFTQLRYSPWLLAGTVIAMFLVYLAPVSLVASGHWIAGAPAWGLMCIAYGPVLRYYRQSPLWAVLLPLVALFYLAATLGSAWNHYSGRGGVWRDRQV